MVEVRAQPLLLRDQPPAPGDQPMVVLQAVVMGRPTFESDDGGVRILRAGQVVIRGRDAAFAMRSDRFAHVTTLALPRHLLAPRYATASMLSGCILPPDDALPARLLHELIAGLGDDDFGAGQAGRLVDVLGGLTALVLGAQPQSPAPLPNLAAARAMEVFDYLERNFANPALDPQRVADDLSISVRYVHKLMQLSGRSFRETLTGLRLDAARRAFAANRQTRETIADIAISVGFNDLSQFNRHFRRAFGMTPRTARRLDETNGYHGAMDAPGPPQISGRDSGQARLAPDRNTL